MDKGILTIDGRNADLDFGDSLRADAKWVKYELPRSVKNLKVIGKNVISIGLGFLEGCTSLEEIDLSSLEQVVEIEDFFLGGCSSLNDIDLSPLSGVSHIGNYFLYRCSSLKHVDSLSFKNLKSVGNGFLFMTPALQVACSYELRRIFNCMSDEESQTDQEENNKQEG